ncbi:EAL domain-containing protein [Undibacterium flavidum]|uniref:EAL domain-containing protein n=1 Tax=Undibacterium flavidum TaxID=2762297 RepID=A0ABR6Y7H2_9BURK|nr:EAL domain-containing protein [Undibacterium flavidum]MBC3872553.1 EAL domain-containing protein [Undibacterium flavidum]
MNIHDLHILVVEDDTFQRRTLLSMLRSLGATTVSESANGKVALDLIRQSAAKPVNVTICDLQMPEMDGMEFLRHLGQEGYDVAIIIASALDSKLLTSVGRMTRMHGIKLLGTIEKPITLERLKELLNRHDLLVSKWQQPHDAITFSIAEIREGIELAQFEPFFQPKIDLRTGRLVGAEALARWIHPVHGVISPYAFIPLLEHSGDIDALTFLILEKSARACKTLLAQGHPLTISVNLSLSSLDKAGLAEKIVEIVNNAGIDADCIVLEVTESAVMTEVAIALENLARLSMNGFALSIDDYGTGYSSLQQLTRIPFSELKIDQCFVKDCTDNPEMSIVVKSSIDLAHKLGIKSVAEGAETQQDWDTLKMMGADTVQGYFIAKPMSQAMFLDFTQNYISQLEVVNVPTPDDSQNHILVVDDDAYMRELIIGVLQDLGFTDVVEADSPIIAMQLFELHSFDLIITDVNMPEMNGLKFIKLLRAGRTLAKRETRVIVITAFSQTEILGAALALDINGFLTKPFTSSQVQKKIEKAMSEKLHLHHPFAYEAVGTEFRVLANQTSVEMNSNETTERRPATDFAASLASNAVLNLASNPRDLRTEEKNLQWSAYDIPLQELRPGMILYEDIFLMDGTQLLFAGHALTELSINRLMDLKDFLIGMNIVVQGAPRSASKQQEP